MAYGDVPPNFDGLPPEAVPWGRWITNEVQQQGKQRNRDSQRISNAINTGQGALSVTEAQGQEIVVAQDTANAAQTEIDVSRQVDPSNLFDMRPILNRDSTQFWTAIPNPAYTEGGTEPFYLFNVETPNITDWFDDGFTITAPRANYEIDFGNLTPYKPAGPVQASVVFNYAYSGPWPTGTTDPAQANLGVRSWVKNVGFPEIWTGQDFPVVGPYLNPASGSYTRVNRSYSMSQGSTNLERWRPAVRVRIPNAGDSFTMRGLRAQAVSGTVAWQTGTLVPDYAISDDLVTTRMVANGAITQAKLDPNISFAPADGSITTAKLANLAVTEPKMADNSVPDRTIISMVATKLTGLIDLARLPASITGRTNVGSTNGQFTNLTRANGTAWVDTMNLTLTDVVTAASGYVFDDGSARRSGQMVELAIKVRRTSGNLVHATPFATLTTAYRTAVLADSPVNGIASGGTAASGMVATIIRSGTHPSVPGGIVAITPAANNTIEVKAMLMMPPGT